MTGLIPRPAATDAATEDRTCDRCRGYVPPSEPGEAVGFFTGAWPTTHALTGARVLLVFGLCSSCVRHEGMDVGSAVVIP